MSENMVQRVAIAIATSHLNDPPDPVCVFDFYALTETVADQYYAMARAAIEAMREPPETMWGAAIGDGGWGDCEASEFVWRWNLAIDAALKD